MNDFNKRDTKNLIIGFGLVAVLLYEIAVMTSPWVIAGIFAFIIVSMVRGQIIRWSDLRRKGYFGGRRVRGGWVYEERIGTQVRSLTLKMENTEPGHYELFLPSESVWRMTVPAWAQDRQQEIVRRIAERLKWIDIRWS